MISSLQADAFVEQPGAQQHIEVRKAVMHDIHPILALINGYAAKGVMLPRTEFELSEDALTDGLAHVPPVPVPG